VKKIQDLKEKKDEMKFKEEGFAKQPG